MVPAMHAAERRSLNSKPSFDTSVTYSLTFSELIVAALGICEEDGVYAEPFRVRDWSLRKGRSFVRRSFREHESAPSRVKRLRHRAGQHGSGIHLITISTFMNTIS